MMMLLLMMLLLMLMMFVYVCMYVCGNGNDTYRLKFGINNGSSYIIIEIWYSKIKY
jgi:hypothetical protein